MNTRREFLKTLGAGFAAGTPLLAASVRGQAAEAKASAKPDKWRMRLSTSTIQFTKLPIEQACKRIADLGFEGVDIWSGHAGCPHLDDVAKRLGGNGLKAVLAKNKLKLYSFSVYRGGYRKYAKLLGDAGGGVAGRGSGGGGQGAGVIPRLNAFFGSL